MIYLAWRYLAHHRYKTAVLVTSMTLIFFIPAGLHVLVNRGEQRLTARAQNSPLLVGAKGSPLELVLNSLYFRHDVPDTLPYAAAKSVTETGFAKAVPLNVRFRAGPDPIVGTSLAYFRYRGLCVEQGRWMTRMGDCVLGANVAARRGIGPGEHVVSSPESVFDIAGVYPLKMRVAGVTAPSDSPDDDAIFVDIKTAWVIQGLAHGHDDVEKTQGAVLRKEGNTVTANASVKEFTEITADNVDAFHFHGDPAAFPITAVLAIPHDTKSATLLRGRYEGAAHQIVRPTDVLDELLATVLTVQGFVVAALVIVGLATLATATLVFLLSLRLRKREIRTMVRIGGSRGAIAGVVLSEICGVLVISALLAIILTWLAGTFGADALRAVLT